MFLLLLWTTVLISWGKIPWSAISEKPCFSLTYFLAMFPFYNNISFVSQYLLSMLPSAQVNNRKQLFQLVAVFKVSTCASGTSLNKKIRQ